ncbi:DUF6461 domain-containing protein [Actinomadura madurae]|uniref:DUF6461 domain-containing protein n=1 Tax=Actinomadura madurae TaxID=1993 RepID=UPI0011601EAF|nr:DUF6461 domain-containing protein [Actinomadura madurae]
MSISYEWMDDESWSWLRNAFCFSFVRGGGSVESTLEKLGTSHPTNPMSIEAMIQHNPFGSDRIIAAIDLGDWVFAWSSRDTSIGRRRSFANMEALSVHRAVNSDITFTYYAAGSMLADFDARHPPATNNPYVQRFTRLLNSQASKKESSERVELCALTLADEITGVHVTSEVMNGSFAWAQMTHPSGGR